MSFEVPVAEVPLIVNVLSRRSVKVPPPAVTGRSTDTVTVFPVTGPVRTRPFESVCVAVLPVMSSVLVPLDVAPTVKLPMKFAGHVPGFTAVTTFVTSKLVDAALAGEMSRATRAPLPTNAAVVFLIREWVCIKPPPSELLNSALRRISEP